MPLHIILDFIDELTSAVVFNPVYLFLYCIIYVGSNWPVAAWNIFTSIDFTTFPIYLTHWLIQQVLVGLPYKMTS